MSVTTFIKSLLPSFERSRVQEDIAEQRQYLKMLLTALENAKQVVGHKPLHSDEGKSLHAMVGHALPVAKSRGLFGGLISFFKEIDTSLRLLEQEVGEFFENDVTAETMTYRRAALLRYLEVTRFASRYTLLATRHVLTAETAVNLKKDSAGEIERALTAYERKTFEQNQQRYVTVLKTLDRSGRQIVDTLMVVPDLHMSADDDKTLQTTVGGAKLDPMRLNFVASNANPIYLVRMVYTNLMHSLYQARVEEARVLELKILELKQSMNGQEDAKTQQAIEYYSGRLDNLHGKIKDYEDDAS